MKTRALLVAVVLLTSGFGEAVAQSSDDSRFAKLEERVRFLEQRVAALEEQPRAAPAPTPIAPGKANWRKLKNGMTEADVERLLGSPTQIDAHEYGIYWSYKLSGGGSVQFDGKSRTVIGWTEPRE